MTDTRQLYEEFLRLEEDLDLFHKRIAGVLFWERVRFDFFIKIVRMDSDIQFAPPKKAGSKLRYYLSSIIEILRNPYFIRRKRILFVSTARRLLRDDGFWWDIYTDPIICKLDIPSVSFEYSFLYNHSKPPRTKTLRYLDILDFFGHVLRVLKLTRIELNQPEKQLLVLVQSEFQKRFGVNIDVRQRVLLMLQKRKVRMPMYLALLKRIKPRFALFVPSYGKEDFIEACKILRIPSAELQHGVIHRFHLGYSYEGKDRRKLTYPDYFLTFGEYWKRGIEYPIPPERIIPVGYPLVDEARKKYRNVERKNQIVFISQTTAGEILSKFALELSKSKNFAYNIVYKLQPQECDSWRVLYPWLIDSKVEVIDQRSDVLHKILAESKIQIGVSSTALYEGLAFGLRTFLLDGPGVEYLEELLKSGTVEKIKDVNQLLEQLDVQHTISFDAEFFFKSNAVRAITDFLKKRVSSS